ncbi:MAG: S16 family serine protease, partial [Thermodesulfobacteriota bacterium]
MQGLIFIATSPNGNSLLESSLMDFSKGIKYAPTLESFDDDLHTIQALDILPHLKTLLYSRLWADQLLDPAPGAGMRDCLARHCPWGAVLGSDMENPGSGQWVKIPVLVARNHSARVVWFIAGLVPSDSSDLFIPPWARKLMDETFEVSIRCAEQYIRHTCADVSDRQFVMFPLAVDSETVQFTGGSAALALGLGMKSLVSGRPVSPDVIATGCLDNNGDITSVGCLDQKVNAALEQGFKCVLHPVHSPPALALREQSHRQMTFYGVSRFDMAWTLATLYSDQHARLLHDFTMALADPGLFIDKMVRFPGQWLEYQQTVVQTLLTDIFADMARFSRFVRTFSDMVRDYSCHDTALALTEPAPKAVPGEWPMAGLIWCTANLALFNHRG